MRGTARSDEINRFLRTGDHDPLLRAWPGSNVLDSVVRGSEALRDALLEEVRRREGKVTEHGPVSPPGDEFVAFTRATVAPMVRGLFSRKESDLVLDLLARSVVFLTREQIEPQIRQASLDTAWKIANIYLGSIGADRLDHNFRHIVGLSVETTCYVSMAYFSDEDPFADFVVHEVAHVFHNCKRRTAGLRETGRLEWLLPIAFRKREL